MTIKDKLKIYLITYNRKLKLKRTFDYIFSDSSPIKDFDITILDNDSTDGTSELIKEYCLKFPNIKHIKHKTNIGGNANIVRAFEMGASSDKEYVWVICDDDKYDFSSWNEVEEAIENKKDVICLCDYLFPNQESKNNPAYQIPQLTFVPSGIYRTELITSDVIINMYDAVITMFAQSCLAIYAVNKGKNVYVLSKPIVYNGIHYDEVDENDVSYIRGKSEQTVLEQRKNTSWIIGFIKVLTLLKDKKIKYEALEAGILYKDICGSWQKFYKDLFNIYFTCDKFQYLYEILLNLPLKNRLDFLTSILIIIIKNIIAFIFSIKNDGKLYKKITILGFQYRKAREPKRPNT